ncbi:MAG: hypothetical protein HY674_09830 [Chloroflexi bacterium]|nr:hypothetical protein [Chloroflexota bacterium]
MIHHLSIRTLLTGLLLLAAATMPAAEDRREKVLKDRAELQADAHWIYNDLPKGFTQASQTGKPLLVVLRCIP